MEAASSQQGQVLARLPATIVALTAAYLLLSTTVGFGWLDSWHDEQRAAQIVLLGLVAVAATGMVVSRSSSGWLCIAWPVPVALALGLASALISVRPLDAVAEVALFTLLVVLAAVAAAFARTAGNVALQGISRATLLLAAAHTVGAFTRYAASIELGHSLGTEVWMLGFSNPRIASSFYALLLPFVAMATLPEAEPDRRLRGAAWIALVGLWTVATGLEARALWFAYCIAVPVLLAPAWAHSTRRLALTLVMTALAGALIQFALPAPINGEAAGPSVSATRDLTSLNARDILWRIALEAILDAPLFGIGPGQFVRFESFAGAHPHNWVLQLASEWGLVALLVVAFGLLALLGRVARQLRTERPGNALLPAAALSVLVGLSSALVDGSLVMPTSQVLFAGVLGLMVGRLTPSEARSAVSRACITRRVAAASAMLTAAFALAAYSVETYPNQLAEKKAFQQRFPGSWLVPRFWENGLKLTQP